MLRLLWGAVGALFVVTAALGQGQFPANTVLGRGSTSGPPTAIPFSTLFSNGRPWADVRAHGAIGDGVTDDTAAVQAAIDTVAALGSGVAFLPPGVYCAKSGLSITTQGVRLVGSGQGSQSVISTCGMDVVLLTANNVRVGIENLRFDGYGASGSAGTFTGATNPVIRLNSSCVECLLTDLTVLGGKYGVENNSGEIYLNRVLITQSYGDLLLNRGGGWLNRVKLDTNWPVSLPARNTTIAAWASGTAYTTGTVVTVSGYWIQATNNGTSGGSAPALKFFDVNIPDNTVTWRLVGSNTSCALRADTGTSELYAHQVDMTGSFADAMCLTNTLAGAAPQFVKCEQCVMSQTYAQTVYLSAGSTVELTDSNIGYCIASNCQAVYPNTAFTGNLYLKGGNITNVSVGVDFQAGSYLSVIGVGISTTDTAVRVGANLSQFVISNNILDGNTTGVTVQVGTSDYYTISNNICGTTATCVSDSGTGTHKSVLANNGSAWIGSATATIGADVLLNNTANFFDGPSAANATSGTWFASGTVTLTGNVGDQTVCKLWDGTTIIASTQFQAPATGALIPVALSGIITKPAANIRISCRDVTTTNGVIKRSDGLSNNASNVTAFRIY